MKLQYTSSSKVGSSNMREYKKRGRVGGSMASNKTLVQDILDAAGGTSNIRSVTHCATRLRLTVNDPAKTKDEQSIKKINGVLGAVMRNDEYQIIIGPGVEAVYLDFLKLGEFKKAEVHEDAQGAPEKRKKVFDPYC